jgi:hypothetical protein
MKDGKRPRGITVRTPSRREPIDTDARSLLRHAKRTLCVPQLIQSAKARAESLSQQQLWFPAADEYTQVPKFTRGRDRRPSSLRSVCMV